MTDISEQWTESDSDLYQKLAPVAVPAREKQIAALLTLMPFSPQEFFRVVELGCGQGVLATALLTGFPQAELVALDGSPAMRAEAAGRLSRFGSRARVAAFDLAQDDWLGPVQGADGVVSSLCLHHLAGPEKRRLFGALYNRLSPRGALLVADLVEPQRPEARTLFAATWDDLAKAQSLALTGGTELFAEFVRAEWNHYDFPDPMDKPSSLFDQLQWLSAAGFEVVDCFWLQAGHAIYGGYKTSRTGGEPGLPFQVALHAARSALEIGVKTPPPAVRPGP